MKQAEDEFNRLTSDLTHEAGYSAYRSQLDTLETAFFNEFKRNNTELVTEKCKLAEQRVLDSARANISLEKEKFPISEKQFNRYKELTEENVRAEYRAELLTYTDSEAYDKHLKTLLVNF